MPAFLITYDIHKGDSEQYRDLIDAIKAYRTWARVTESSWIVVTEDDASAIRDNLSQHMDDEDRLFVLKSGVAAAWKNVRCKSSWLKKWL
jgi:hypothetical protein